MSSVTAGRVSLERLRDWISFQLLQQGGLTSGGDAGAARSAGMREQLRERGCLLPGLLAAEMFSLRVRFDLELYELVFTVVIPSWAATVKAGSVSIISPP